MIALLLSLTAFAEDPAPAPAPVVEAAPAPEPVAAAEAPASEPAPAPTLEAVPLSEAPPAEKTKKPPREWSLAGLPIANFSSDTGVGYGLYGTVVHNPVAGSEDPYRARVALQIFATTKKYQDHNLKLDFPGIFGSKYRYDLVVGYEAWKQAQYYGYGNLSPREEVDDPTFYQYDVRWWRLLTNLRRDVGGPWQVFGQYMLRVATVAAYDDSRLDVDKPIGIEGGLYARLGGGVMFDTRDQEPSPTSGVFAEASARVSAPIVGSKWIVGGFNTTFRHWVGFGERKRLVLANRVIFDARRGEEPFFSAHLLGGSSFVEVGGSNVLRGLPNARYLGDVVVVWSPELRWIYASPGPLDMMLVPFFDVERSFLWKDSPALEEGIAIADDNLLHLHYSGGLGARFQLGTNMLVRLDVALGSEEYGTDGVIEEKKPNLGVYLVFDHPY